MKEEEKQRKFHEALLKMLYPPPPSPPSDQEDQAEEEKLVDTLNDLPDAEAELDNEEHYSVRSTSDDKDGENGGPEKMTRAQRKRLRKKKLKGAASRRGKIIGPLLPGSRDDGSDGSVDVLDHMPESVRQNAADSPNNATKISGEPPSCSKQNKIKRRRKSKKLAGKKSNSLSIESCNSPQSQGQIVGTDDRTNS